MRIETGTMSIPTGIGIAPVWKLFIGDGAKITLAANSIVRVL